MIILDSLPTMTKQPLKKRYGAEFSCIEDILGYKTYIAACEGPFVGTSQKKGFQEKDTQEVQKIFGPTRTVRSTQV
jgi:hypothetical protein